MIECKECGVTFELVESFHRHLKKHKQKKREYYEKHYPKFCLATNKKIVWKESDKLEDYLGRDFIDQNALRNYFLGSINTEEKLKMLESYLVSSHDKHSIAPSEVEWSSLQLSPNILLTDNYFNYQNKCTELGFKTRFNYSFEYKGYKLPIIKVPVEEFCIQIDTREINGYSFFSSITSKISVGDYCLASSNFNNIVIERKSIQDFGGTMGSGLERFEDELKRTRELGRYMVMLIEYPLNDIYGYKFYGRCQAGYFLHNLRDLFRRYSDIMQPVFGGHRYKCVKLVPLFLLCGTKCKEIDLQLWVEYNNYPPMGSIFTKNDLYKMYE